MSGYLDSVHSSPGEVFSQYQFARQGGDISRLQETGKASGKGDGESLEKLKKVSQEFEAIFLQQMLDAMDKTVERTGLLDGGHAEEVFRGMMNQQIALQATQGGGPGFGLAEAIYRQMAQVMKPEAGSEGGGQ